MRCLDGVVMIPGESTRRVREPVGRDGVGAMPRRLDAVDAAARESRECHVAPTASARPSESLRAA